MTVDPQSLQLVPGALTFSQLRDFWRCSTTVTLDPSCRPAIEASAETVAAILRDGRSVYGINTGFGSLAGTTIASDQVTELQRRLVLSHCTGVGEPLAERIGRLVLLLKINALARGYSGIRIEVIETLLALLNAGLVPVMPAKGSVGASGDLAPLAHLASVLLGEGEVMAGGERMTASRALARVGFNPIHLGAKEGLALLNGTQVSTAIALNGLFSGLNVFAAALVAGAMSVDAALGSDVPFDPRIHAARGQPGQVTVAAILADLLEGSGIRSSHWDCGRVQDPYSLRCQPQVMGAALDVLTAAAAMVLRETNAVSDNPLVFSDSGDILSGGNFHAEPVAMAADMMAIALAEVGALSERRIALLTDPHMSLLPAFLVAEPGLNSGFMNAQVTAAALASENKGLAHPASVDSLPTSANQEDHVSMAAYAARRVPDIAWNSGHIVAIELLAAAQGIDLRQPLETSGVLREVLGQIRERAPFLAVDRPLSQDFAAVHELLSAGWFVDTLNANSKTSLLSQLNQ